MSVYKDEKTGSWYVKCYYEDYTGTRKQKMKMGFPLQRDAKEWGRQFLEQQQGTPDMSLYYTGMRIGELMALTFADVDLKAGTISINKTYHKIDGKTVITPPKTEKGNRIITIPRFLRNCLGRHMKRIYGATAETRIFQSSKDPYLQHMKKHEALAGLRHIRLHDLRHPYVKSTTKKYLFFLVPTIQLS